MPQFRSKGLGQVSIDGEPLPRRGFVGLLAASGVALWAPGAQAAVRVKGLLQGGELLLNPVWEESRDAANHGFSFREPVPTVHGRFRKLFPYLPREVCVALLAEGKQAPMRAMGIIVGGGRTAPVTVVVTPGTRLDFQNKDPFAHRLYGINVPNFSLSDTAKGSVRQWSVPGPGTFEIRDQLAPSLRAWVVGEPNVVSLVYPTTKGEFALSVPEPGNYTVQAYFCGKKIGEGRPVTVQARDVDLSRAPISLVPSSPTP
ncbi:MAG: hypothetical protein SFV15_03330 [Polyangiaceae bacterium]|nr:hypothetical protein [Polyangiaceae bacterium]